MRRWLILSAVCLIGAVAGGWLYLDRRANDAMIAQNEAQSIQKELFKPVCQEAFHQFAQAGAAMRHSDYAAFLQYRQIVMTCIEKGQKPAKDDAKWLRQDFGIVTPD